jgi:hypothetical protein
MHLSRIASRAALACALLLMAGCAAEPAPAGDLPPRWIGVGDLSVLVTAGGDELDPARVSLTWENLDRRRPDREPERGQAAARDDEGRWRIESLAYGTYELTVHYADGPLRVRRVELDEADERVDIDLPAGRLVLRAADGAPELERVELRSLSLRHGTAVRTWEEPAGLLLAEGLGAGRYLVHTTFAGYSHAYEHVQVADAASETVVLLRPAEPGNVRLVLTGWAPRRDEEERILVEAYAQAPEDRQFDFGDVVLSRAAPGRGQTLSLPLTAGRYGLLISSRSSLKGRTGLLAFVPDVVVEPARTTDMTVEIVEPRRVLVRSAGEAPLTPQDYGFRFGEDLLPGRLASEHKGAWRTDGVLLPPLVCAVVSGSARRRGGAEGGSVVAVRAGDGVQEVEVARE